MGWLTTAGSLGRIAFPLLAGASVQAAQIVNVLVGVLSVLIVFEFAHCFDIPLWPSSSRSGGAMVWRWWPFQARRQAAYQALT